MTKYNALSNLYESLGKIDIVVKKETEKSEDLMQKIIKLRNEMEHIKLQLRNKNKELENIKLIEKNEIIDI
jgi:hypothetical protein